MSKVDVKEFLGGELAWAGESYVKDMEALSPEQMAEAPNGTARRALDYTYECIVFNRMVAARLRGEEPPAWPWEDEWATAPEGYTKDQALEDMKNSVAEMQAAFDQVDVDFLLTQVERPDGRKVAPIESVSHAIQHLAHHGGQLNMLQLLHGDKEMHWM